MRSTLRIQAVTSIWKVNEERFAKGEPQKQLSKEFVREWLMENGFQGKEGQQVPEMTPEIVNSISERYMELFEHNHRRKICESRH